MTTQVKDPELILVVLAVFFLSTGLFALFRSIFSKGLGLAERSQPHFAALAAQPEPLYYGSRPISEVCKVFKRKFSGVLCFESYAIENGALIQKRFRRLTTKVALRDMRGYHISPVIIFSGGFRGRVLCLIDANGAVLGNFAIDSFDSIELVDWVTQNLIKVPAEITV